MRGKIRNRERAKQLRDFTGLRWGKITPTDIDAFTEFGDKVFVFVEAKVNGVAMPFGQRLAFERLCDAVAESGRTAVYFVVEHDSNPEIDVDYANCPVEQYRYNCEWHKPAEQITCKKAIDALRSREGI